LRTFNQAIEAVESYSPAEEQFNRRRRTVGLWLAPALAIACVLAPLPLPAPAHRMAAILVLVVTLWITEALPMAVTALLGPILAVVSGVAGAREALAPFADPIIFLFIGSFILAEAMFVHGVDRRIAYTALASRFVGISAPRLLVVYGAVAVGLSMWISNTATTAMMFPIGLSLVNHLMRVTPREEAARRSVRQFALGLMLLTSFGASVGGMATPVGTPPNLIGIGMLERIAGIRVRSGSRSCCSCPCFCSCCSRARARGACRSGRAAAPRCGRNSIGLARYRRPSATRWPPLA
jgi:sodium-dependent dicarboxylate transporter 2/3/5